MLLFVPQLVVQHSALIDGWHFLTLVYAIGLDLRPPVCLYMLALVSTLVGQNSLHLGLGDVQTRNALVLLHAFGGRGLPRICLLVACLHRHVVSNLLRVEVVVILVRSKHLGPDHVRVLHGA